MLCSRQETNECFTLNVELLFLTVDPVSKLSSGNGLQLFPKMRNVSASAALTAKTPLREFTDVKLTRHCGSYMSLSHVSIYPHEGFLFVVTASYYIVGVTRDW